jgi:hypothetical protein
MRFWSLLPGLSPLPFSTYTTPSLSNSPHGEESRVADDCMVGVIIMMLLDFMIVCLSLCFVDDDV